MYKDNFKDLMVDYTEITWIKYKEEEIEITKTRYWITFIEIHNKTKLFRWINKPTYIC